MNRRDFVKYMALIAAGTAAQSEQIAAYLTYYEANIPQTTLPLAAIDEIFIGGKASHSVRATFQLLIQDEGPTLSFSLNLYGGIVRWVAAPDGKIVRARDEVGWHFQQFPGDLHEGEKLSGLMDGYISFVDQDAKRHYVPVVSAIGSLCEVA